MSRSVRDIPQTPAELALTLEDLRTLFPADSDVTTVYVRSNRAGDEFRFKVLARRPAHGRYAESNYSIHNVAHLLVKAGLGKLDADLNIVVGGGNMDMAADLTLRLSSLLYGDAYHLTNHAL